MGKTSDILRKLANLSPDLSTDGEVLRCNVCDVVVNHARKSNVTQHLETAKHLNGLKRRDEKRLRQPFLNSATLQPVKDQFANDLAKTFVECDIPLYKMRHPAMKALLEKYTDKIVPSETTLRSKIPGLFLDRQKEIKLKLKGKKLWVSVDETTDSLKRCVVILVAGVLDSGSKGVVLESKFFETVQASTIVQFYQDTLTEYEIDKNEVLVFTSDAALYMVKVGKLIMAIYPKVVHVTCLIHRLHRVCETIRSKFDDVNGLISSVKKIFTKAPSRIRLFKEKCPNIPLPPEPITTRWGTWLEAAVYYADHFVKIRNVVVQLDAEDATSIGIAQNLFAKSTIVTDLVKIKHNFSFMLPYIKMLQGANIDLKDAKKTVEDVMAKFNSMSSHDQTLQSVKAKWEKTYNKNIGLKRLMDLEGGESGGINYTVIDLCAFKYAPVDCERSFSMYKSFYRDNRHGFIEANQRQYFLLYCNRDF